MSVGFLLERNSVNVLFQQLSTTGNVLNKLEFRDYTIILPQDN